MKKVAIVNLGCKVNQYESDTIAGVLTASGFSVVFGHEFADVYFVNTCAVTNEGERKSRNMITKLLKINPKADVYVAGCASENNSEHFRKYQMLNLLLAHKIKFKLLQKYVVIIMLK